MVSTSELPQSALSEAAAGAFSVNLGAAQQKLWHTHTQTCVNLEKNILCTKATENLYFAMKGHMLLSCQCSNTTNTTTPVLPQIDRQMECSDDMIMMKQEHGALARIRTLIIADYTELNLLICGHRTGKHNSSSTSCSHYTATLLSINNNDNRCSCCNRKTISAA